MKQKWKNDRGNIRKVHKKIIFRGYGDAGNKLRRRKSRQMRSGTKEVKKKRDKEIIWKRKMRSRNKRWTKKEKKKKKEEKRKEKKNGETKERKKKRDKDEKKIRKTRDRGEKEIKKKTR